MNRARRRGFGLVEVLVSLALGTFVAVAALAVHARVAVEARTALALQQAHEAARAAGDLLERELRAAGHLGPAPDAAAVANRATAGTRGRDFGASQCGPAVATDLARPVTAADGHYALQAGSSLACAPAPSGRTVAGADTLTIRRAGAEPAPAERGRLQLAATRSRGLLFADGRVPLLGPGTAVHDLEVGVYYVAADSSAGAGVPALRRKRLVGGSDGPRFEDEELVVGVEELQVEFGVDGPDPDETPERYVTAADVAADDTTRTVRLTLGVAVRGDARPRLLVVRTVYLRNLRRG